MLVAKGKCTVEEIQSGKEILRETVSLLIGLIRRINPDRLGEEVVEYRLLSELAGNGESKSKSKIRSKNKNRKGKILWHESY